MKKLKITLNIGRVMEERYLDLDKLPKNDVRGWDKDKLDLLRNKIEEIIKEKANKALKSGNHTHFTEVLVKILILLAIEEVKHLREINELRR
ncbi:MAG: hypothetical protein ABIL16_01615 [candidate division WOR-3 bacterium]